jgi:hypothetical protein
MKILFDGEEVADDLTVMNVVDENGQQVGYRRLTTEEQVAYNARNIAWDNGLADRLKEKVNNEASVRILALEGGLPLWKQINMVARRITLDGKESLNEDEQTEKTSLIATFDTVNEVRDASNTLHAQIDGMSLDDQKVFNPLDSDHWP